MPPHRGRNPQSRPNRLRVSANSAPRSRKFLAASSSSGVFRHRFIKIDRSPGNDQPRDARTFNPAPVGEKLQADERWISSECRRPRIRRVAISGWAQRQNLPHMLLCASQKAKKLVRCGAQIADASIRRQRTYVQQNSAGSLKLHEADITGWIAVCRKRAGFETLLGVHPNRFVPPLKRQGSPSLKTCLSSVFLRVSTLVSILAVFAPQISAAPLTPQPITLASGWQLQDVAKVPQAGAQVSSAGFDTAGWYPATVPGTVLTSASSNAITSILNTALRRERAP